MQLWPCPPAIRSASPCPGRRQGDPCEPAGDASETDPFEELGDLLDRADELDRADDDDEASFGGIVTI